MSDELLYRASTVADVDFKFRLIDVIAVPYEEETEVMWHGELWREVFDRGSFNGIEDHAGRVRVNREHVRGDTVGKVVSFDSTYPAGLLAHIKIAPTPRGDDTLTLAADDMISSSISFRVKQPSDVQLNKRVKLRRVLRAFLDHIAMVESPRIQVPRCWRSERDRQGSRWRSPRCRTHRSLDVFRDDEVLQWATRRLAQTPSGGPHHPLGENDG